LYIDGLKAGLCFYVAYANIDWFLKNASYFSLAFCSFDPCTFCMEVENDGKPGLFLQAACKITHIPI
jgi:hypothetical protein